LRIRIDPDVDTFLLDHVVDGSPVLPTVVQLDLAARTLRAVDPDWPAGLLLTDITVGTPVRIGARASRQLDLLCTKDTSPSPGRPRWRVELHSPGEDAAHLTLVAGHATGSAPPLLGPAGWAGIPCGAELVYPPFFHGPAFQVIARFGRAGPGLAATLAPALYPVVWASGPTILRSRLLELLLQCCGLHELARSGRMMVPAAIEAVHWHPASLAADDKDDAVAVVWPRPGHRPGRVFDGRVLAPGGTPLVTVTGYHPADLGTGPDHAHAAVLSRCLDRHPDPGPRVSTETTISEGAPR
jgi:hypothetical protein